MDMEKIGRFIAACRKEKGFTQDDLAELLGITQKSVSRWETGKNLPDASLFKPLCDTLGISINELFAGEKIEKERAAQKADENIVSIVSDNNRRKRILGRIIAVFAVLCFALMAVFTGSSSKANKLKTDLDSAQKDIRQLQEQIQERPVNVIEYHAYSNTENDILSSFGKHIILRSFDSYPDKSFDSLELFLSVYESGQEVRSERVGAMFDLARFFKDGTNEDRINIIVIEDNGNYKFKLTIEGFGCFVEYDYRDLITLDKELYYSTATATRTTSSRLEKGQRIELFSIGFSSPYSSTTVLSDPDIPAGLKGLDYCFVFSCTFD